MGEWGDKGEDDALLGGRWRSDNAKAKCRREGEMKHGQGPAGSPHAVRAREALGAKVVNREGEHLGQLEDIVLEVTGGRVAYAVISVAAMEEGRLARVPWGRLAWEAERKEWVVDVTAHQFAAGRHFAPRNGTGKSGRTKWRAAAKGRTRRRWGPPDSTPA